MSRYHLPKDFVWGVATTLYRLVGAVMDEGRGLSISDLLTRRVRGWVADVTTGDVADLFYCMYPQDIERMAAPRSRYY